MFRNKSKRKGPNQIRVTEEDDDDDDQGEQTNSLFSGNNKRTVVRSFEDEGDSVPTKKKKNSKRKRRGLGFGGAAPVAADDEVSSSKQPRPSSYSSEALKELKSKQAYSKTSDTADTPESPLTDHQPDFIPLRGDCTTTPSEPKVLSGEAAFALEGEADLPVPPQADPSYEKYIPMDNESEYEADIASRAGVQIQNDSHRRQTKMSLNEVRSQIERTLQGMENRSEDDDQANRRRTVELEHARAELERHQADLEQAGSAVEYYQDMRSQLADWVGAMRSLHTKLIPLMETDFLIESEFVARDVWRDYEDAAAAVLKINNLLDHVEGRVPRNFEELADLPTIDEFGRDVKSQEVRERDQIFRRRSQARDAQHNDYNAVDNSSMHTIDELKDFEERKKNLKNAVSVALNELDSTFWRLENLVAFFGKWKDAHPRDFRQAFATLSLADLASVLVLLDLVGEKQLGWKGVVDNAIEAGILSDADVERLVRNSILPYIQGVLKHTAYSVPVAEETSLTMQLFVMAVSLLPSPECKVVLSLRDVLRQYFADVLNDLSIHVPVSGIVLEENAKFEVQSAVSFATRECLDRILFLLKDILINWGPIFREDAVFAQAVLEFCCGPFLNFILALPEDLKKPAILQVSGDISKLGWMEAHMVQAMPLRAARAIYD